MVIDKKHLLTNKVKINFNKIAKLLSKNVKQLFDVSIIGDQEIKMINKKCRKVDKVTDVISFAFNDAKKTIHSELIGEIFINYQQAKRQTKIYGFTLEREITFLFLHGLLHLLGFDHMKPKDEKKMIAKQNNIMRAIKIIK
jgi:probable rRNA maturation factor